MQCRAKLPNEERIQGLSREMAAGEVRSNTRGDTVSILSGQNAMSRFCCFDRELSVETECFDAFALLTD